MNLWEETQRTLTCEPGLHIQEGPGGTLCGAIPEIGEPRIGLRTAHQFLRDAVDCVSCRIIAGQRFEEFGWEPIPFGPYTWGPCEFCGKHGDESTMDPLSGDGQGCGDCVDNWLQRLRAKGEF